MARKTTSKGTTFTATTPVGEVVTRTSKTREYAYVVLLVTHAAELAARYDRRADTLKADGRPAHEWYREEAASLRSRAEAIGSNVLYDAYRWSSTLKAAEAGAREAKRHHPSRDTMIVPVDA